MEYWKPIESLNGRYSISNHGQVRSNKSGRVLKYNFKNQKGYAHIKLDGKMHSAHRLVAIHFLDNPKNLPQVNHKDEDKVNNHVDNLEWCTSSYNMEYSRSKHFGFISPEGELFHVFNLQKFCRERGLPVGNMHRLWSGKHKVIKGWTRASAENLLDVVPSF